ncbi:hypothetical protein JOS77_13860 [Chromobacterium haemolyticum]|nr:hypothetical protein JOS77_13860 [Chromobacterium haemolyticum]
MPLPVSTGAVVCGVVGCWVPAVVSAGLVLAQAASRVTVAVPRTSCFQFISIAPIKDD